MDDEDLHYRRCRLLHHINKRYIVMFICCFYTFNVNVIRELTTMTLPVWSNITNQRIQDIIQTCNLSQPFNDLAIQITPKIIYSLDERQVETLHTAYYVGAAITKLIGGIIADKHGGRRILLFYGIAAFVMVIIYPSIVQHANGKYTLICVWHFLLGIITGPVFPTVNSVTAHWAPKGRRTTMICFVNVTFSMAGVTAHTLFKCIVSKTNYWPWAYYIVSCMLLLNLFLWYFFGYSCVDNHPFISKKEKRFLYKELGKSLLPFKQIRIPWLKIFTSIPFWASYFNHLGRGWAFFNMYIYVPMYLKTVLHTDLSHNFVVGQIALYFLMGMSDLCSGLFCDYLVNKDIMDITTTRKIFSNFGAVGVGVYCMTTSFTGCNQKLGYALFCIILIHMGAYNTGVAANDIDLSCNFAGTLKGITDSSEHLLTLALPSVLNALLKDHSVYGWRYTFLILLAVVMVTNVCFTIAGRAREQAWNNPYKKEK